MHLSDSLDSITMIKPRVDANLIQHYDSSRLGSSLERADRRRDIASRDDVRLALDGGVYDLRMVHKGYERDDEVVGRYLLV